jgi:hypothetical protein
MTTTWTVDSNQSDVLIKMRHSIIAYIDGTVNKLNEILYKDATIELHIIN